MSLIMPFMELCFYKMEELKSETAIDSMYC